MIKMFGYDFPMTPVGLENISFQSVGMENDNGMFDSGVVRGQEYFMSGLTADMVKKLKEGTAYLKFWIVAIEHTIPTANKKLYPAAPFQKGLESPSFQRQLQLGGVAGEAEHPMIKMYSEDPNAQLNIYNNLARVCRIEPSNRSHFVTAYKCTPEKTYFEIKTNPDNPIIVNDILAGKKPAFSIRTRGDFETREDGITVATSLEVIGIDYVGNPANATSVAFPTFKAFDGLTGKEELEMNLLPKTGTESVGMENVIPEGAKVYYDPNLSGLDAIANLIIVKDEPKKTKVGFESAFSIACNSFLD